MWDAIKILLKQGNLEMKTPWTGRAAKAIYALSFTLGFFSITASAEVPDWPDLYDPFTLYTLNVETVDPADFDLIRNDTTYDIEVPAWFWAENEEPILVSIRRKSASALPNELDPNKKVSFKIDINEYHDTDGVDICAGVPGITEGCVSKWKEIKKLSLMTRILLTKAWPGTCIGWRLTQGWITTQASHRGSSFTSMTNTRAFTSTLNSLTNSS
jgi:hypothetical protein